ncbi:hypothetical protein K505DRAFT_378372 [Melanomma pulvis-pyrius CBS 109.77]|uniref:Uncharacterized protein n=1 Tax=Melanomma pulvis-pyrius CBS 109.77 TaxID=1314802 RepID=A0A6A6WZ94_9PLEO|nr:hypothetical protein K505DRAFT_378372 [Melanomma pulvis-pyrius CBS 109.77]
MSEDDDDDLRAPRLPRTATHAGRCAVGDPLVSDGHQQMRIDMRSLCSLMARHLTHVKHESISSEISTDQTPEPPGSLPNNETKSGNSSRADLVGIIYLYRTDSGGRSGPAVGDRAPERNKSSVHGFSLITNTQNAAPDSPKLQQSHNEDSEPRSLTSSISSDMSDWQCTPTWD